MKSRGFTLIEVMVVVSIFAIGGLLIVGSVLNNRGATETRALNAARSYIESNSISPKRVSCAGDSDGDGYGTCNVVTNEGEKIVLNCPTDYLQVEVFHASSCKEILNNYNLSFGANQ